MAHCRPVISVYKFDEPASKESTLKMPAVMCAPLRLDIVRNIHALQVRNQRQPQARKYSAGEETSAKSWGTGRAVARIPRVPGGGTHRAGQATGGNMCRGGRTHSGFRITRKFYRKINVRMRRQAICAGIAASALPPLVMSRGHRIDDVTELPLVVNDGLECVKRAKTLVEILKGLGLGPELQKVIETQKRRSTTGKWRGRRKMRRCGPLIVYNENNGIRWACQSIPGVKALHYKRLNVLDLCPGGRFGRMIVWTEGAIKGLNDYYGNYTVGETKLSKFHLPRAKMMNPDLAFIVNSTEVQSVLRPKKEARKLCYKRPDLLKKANRKRLLKADPYFPIRNKVEQKTEAEWKQVFADRKKARKESAAINKAYQKKIKAALTPKPVAPEKEADDEE